MRLAIMGSLACILIAGITTAQDAKDDLKKMAGKWKVVVNETDGKPLPKELIDKFASTLIVEGDKYKVYFGDKLADEGTMKLDAAKNPKEIDATPSKNPAMKGIYKIDGDTMTVCFSKPGGDRPAEFKSKEGTGQILLGYTRIKP
jgi:uncharacterized protein (TIGR03067 family)